MTAPRAPDIALLAADGGPLQMSLFDEQDFALPQSGAGSFPRPEKGGPAGRDGSGPRENIEVRGIGPAEGRGQDRRPDREGNREAQGRQASRPRPDLHSRHKNISRNDKPSPRVKKRQHADSRAGRSGNAGPRQDLARTARTGRQGTQNLLNTEKDQHRWHLAARPTLPAPSTASSPSRSPSATASPDGRRAAWPR